MTVCNVVTKHQDAYPGLEKFGLFQISQYFLICLSLFMVSMMHVNYVFIAEDVDYRCKVPVCENINSTSQLPSWWPDNISNPKCYRPVLDVQKYDEANNVCTNATFTGILEECNDWIFETNNSIVAELKLGCESWKSSLVGTAHNAGMIVSMLFAGWLADRIGRKPTVIICSAGGFIGVFKIFITNYYAYITLEFLESVVASGLYTVGIVLLIEVGGETKRVITGVIFSYAVYMGEIVFAFIAMGLKYWKHLILVVYAPMILFIGFILVLKESPRWQLLHDKIDDVKKTFHLTAKMNKLDITKEEINAMKDDDIRNKFNMELKGSSEKESMKNIMMSKELLTRLAVSSFCFFTSSFLYYGLVIHSILLPGDKYTNFVMASVVSFPGDFLTFYTMNNYGRKITLQCGYLLCAAFLIAQTYSPESITWLKIVLFLIGKLGVVICFTGIYTYSLELFPTSVRGSLFGWGNTAARIGSMLAPLTPLLGAQMEALPSILFSSTAVVSALLLTFTPETKTLPLFDTIAQVDAYQSKLTTHL